MAEWQQRSKALGFDLPKIDGIFSGKTVEAVRSCRQNRASESTGQVRYEHPQRYQ